MRKLRPLILFVLSGLVISTLLAAVLSQTREKESPLKLTISVDGSLCRAGDGSKIHVVLKNVSNASIRLMEIKDHPSLARVFFLADVSDLEGNLIAGLVGGSKAEIPLKLRTYIQVEPGEETRFDINVNDLLPVRTGIRAGTYELRLTYFSQYGDGFRGQVTGEPIRVTIVDELNKIERVRRVV